MSIDFTLAPEHEAIRLRVREFITDVVKPGEDKRLTYSYVVKIGGKLELVGGNRRE